MRYHARKPDLVTRTYGDIYICDHPVYNRCTLFRDKDKGLAIIQQRYSPINKMTMWTEIDDWIANDLYLDPGFYEFFENRAEPASDGLYPTVTVRQIMWALKMKPLEKERWETVFDHKNI